LNSLLGASSPVNKKLQVQTSGFFLFFYHFCDAAEVAIVHKMI
jgi:hypothetical protein